MPRVLPAPAFYLKTGELSSYGFRCGYVQERTYPGNGGGRVYMYQEGNAYHVRFGPPPGEAPHWHDFNSRKWHTLDTLGEARKEYRRQCRKAYARWKKYTGRDK